jgi:hypothetical protein
MDEFSKRLQQPNSAVTAMATDEGISLETAARSEGHDQSSYEQAQNRQEASEQLPRLQIPTPSQNGTGTDGAMDTPDDHRPTSALPSSPPFVPQQLDSPTANPKSARSERSQSFPPLEDLWEK